MERLSENAGYDCHHSDDDSGCMDLSARQVSKGKDKLRNIFFFEGQGGLGSFSRKTTHMFTEKKKMWQTLMMETVQVSKKNYF